MNWLVSLGVSWRVSYGENGKRRTPRSIGALWIRHRELDWSWHSLIARKFISQVSSTAISLSPSFTNCPTRRSELRPNQRIWMGPICAEPSFNRWNLKKPVCDVARWMQER